MSSYPLRRGEVVQGASAEGWTVYEQETDSLHVLNATARAIWELCDGETSPAEMANAITELTGVELDQANRDVESTLRSLRRLGLVSID